MMFIQAEELRGDRYRIVTSVLLLTVAAAVFLTYLIPQWYSFFSSKVFVFTNGWDEEYYLSWQGVEGIKNSISYLSLHLSWLMHRLGVSGAVQNLFLDTLLPPATAFLAWLSIRKYGTPGAVAAGYAVLICFGSVLFNANNPFISSLLGETRTSTIVFMMGWEVYPSILRTPNPEISFFLISLAIYGYVRFERWWLLLLPFPLLYYYSAVSYAFVLLTSFIYVQLRSRSAFGVRTAALGAAFSTFVAMGIGVIGLSFVMGLYQPQNPLRSDPFVFSETRWPQFPVGTLILTAVFTAGIRAKLLELESEWIVPLLVLAAASVGAVNLHLFTGFMVAQKNYYDYGLSVIFSIALVIAIQSIRWEVARNLVLVAVLIWVSALCYKSQKIWLGQATKYGAEIAPGIERIREDPLRAIIPDWSAMSTGMRSFNARVSMTGQPMPWSFKRSTLPIAASSLSPWTLPTRFLPPKRCGQSPCRTFPIAPVWICRTRTSTSSNRSSDRKLEIEMGRYQPGNLARLARTVRYMRPGQVVNRIARRFTSLPPTDGPAPALRATQSTWRNCPGRLPSMLSPELSIHRPGG